MKISPLYEKAQIVNRSDSHEITYYRYHQWAIRPSVAIMEVTRAYLEDGIFSLDPLWPVLLVSAITLILFSILTKHTNRS